VIQRRSLPIRVWTKILNVIKLDMTAAAIIYHRITARESCRALPKYTAGPEEVRRGNVAVAFDPQLKRGKGENE